MTDVFYCGMGAIVILAILMAIDPQFDVPQSPWEE